MRKKCSPTVPCKAIYVIIEKEIRDGHIVHKFNHQRCYATFGGACEYLRTIAQKVNGVIEEDGDIFMNVKYVSDVLHVISIVPLTLVPSDAE